jgi:hypothetical protein
MEKMINDFIDLINKKLSTAIESVSQGKDKDATGCIIYQGKIDFADDEQAKTLEHAIPGYSTREIEQEYLDLVSNYNSFAKFMDKLLSQWKRIDTLCQDSPKSDRLQALRDFQLVVERY